MPCPLSCRRLDITSIRSNSTAASWNQPGNQPATHTKRASLAVTLASTSSVAARAPPATPTLRRRSTISFAALRSFLHAS
eukprot:915770-Pleurochrysis_carterae.AAC.1